MALTIDGNSLVFEGTVTITNFTNPTNGVCTLTLTPSGGVGQLPALLAGTPGQPAIFDSVSATTLAAGQPATIAMNEIDPGGPGEAAHYTLAFGIPQGAQGIAGDFGTISGATDLSGTAAVGKMMTVSATGPTAFTYSAVPFGSIYNASTIANISEAGASSATLCAISIPAQPYAWYPKCYAQATVVGTTSTAVNLQATLNATNGNVLGLTQGYAGQTTQRLTMIPSYGSLIGSGSNYAKVAANTAVVIYLVAIETASVPDTWVINNASASFTVEVLPVAS